jgi:hypothetical protein
MRAAVSVMENVADMEGQSLFPLQVCGSISEFRVTA